jgi:cation transport ATPase
MADAFDAVSGAGVRARIGGHDILLGNANRLRWIRL